MAEDNTNRISHISQRGLGSPNMSDSAKRKIQSMGGKAQPLEAKREGGRRGGAKSRRTS